MNEMSVVQIAFADVERELENTRKVLARVPTEHLSWKPHQKSMSLGELAQHVAQLPWFFEVGVRQNEYDIAGWQRPAALTSAEEIVRVFDERAAGALSAIRELTPEGLMETWTFRAGAHVIFSMPRGLTLRTLAMSHIVHHRAQLTVYLRLLEVPIPGMYGPSSDEQ